MLRKVHLYGDLAEKYGSEHKLDINSVGEAMRALEANHKGFLKSIKRDGHYKVFMGKDLDGEGDYITKESIEILLGDKDLHISPVSEGSGGDEDAWWMVVIGAVLIVASIWCKPLLPIGISMLFSGASQLLSAPPSTDYDNMESPEKRVSFFFNGPQNTIEQGGVLPLVYGRMTVGSSVVSAGLRIESL